MISKKQINEGNHFKIWTRKSLTCVRISARKLRNSIENGVDFQIKGIESPFNEIKEEKYPNLRKEVITHV
jgi:hypothetical protein